MNIPKFTLADLLKIQVAIGIISTLVSYPFFAVYWFIRNGVASFSLSGILSELLTLTLLAGGTGLAMAVMALVAYPALKMSYRRGWLT